MLLVYYELELRNSCKQAQGVLFLFIKDIKYALTYLSACNGEVDDITRRGEGMKYRKMEGRNRKYEEELDDDNDENVEKVILLNWESLMCKAP